MKALILKDILVLKSQIRFYMIFLIFYGFISVYSGNLSMFTTLIGIFGLMLPLTAISYDERSGWEKYALSGPVNRKEMVMSKYMLGLLLILAGFLISSLLAVCGDVFGVFLEMPLNENLILIGIFTIFSLFYLSFILPMTFKLGTEKSRIYMMAVVLLPFILLIILDQLGFAFPEFEQIPWKMLLLISASGTMLLFLASIALSISIYKKKEF